MHEVHGFNCQKVRPTEAYSCYFGRLDLIYLFFYHQLPRIFTFLLIGLGPFLSTVLLKSTALTTTLRSFIFLLGAAGARSKLNALYKC